jgi:bifunctional DNA-binding transcriptional regulator/antitoxin component of YhaV-PrlF toxin-antitoxin module
METGKSAVAEIKARGQLTIPKKMREMSNMDEGSVVSIVPVGDSLIISPRRLELDEARRQLGRLVKASGVSIEKLIGGLKVERSELYNEIYGPKKKV